MIKNITSIPRIFSPKAPVTTHLSKESAEMVKNLCQKMTPQRPVNNSMGAFINSLKNLTLYLETKLGTFRYSRPSDGRSGKLGEKIASVSIKHPPISFEIQVSDGKVLKIDKSFFVSKKRALKKLDKLLNYLIKHVDKPKKVKQIKADLSESW